MAVAAARHVDEHALLEMRELDEAVAAKIVSPVIDVDLHDLFDHDFAQATRVVAAWHVFGVADDARLCRVLRVVRVTARGLHFVERATRRGEAIAATQRASLGWCSDEHCCEAQ